MDRWRPKRDENPPPTDGDDAGPEDDEPYHAELWLAEIASGPGQQGDELPGQTEVESPEQTEVADPGPVIWDRANRKHLIDDHPERGVSLTEIEEALNDPDRIEEYDVAKDSYESLGRTEAGRWLLVVWVEVTDGRYPVHAHQAGRGTLKRWQK